MKAPPTRFKKILGVEEVIMLSTSPMELRLANQKLGNRFIKTLQAMNELDMGEFFNAYAQKPKIPPMPLAMAFLRQVWGLN